MGSILIAMPKNDDATHLAQMVNTKGLMLDVEICQTGAEVLRIANARDYGVVLCTKNLRDMSCLELAEYLPQYFGMVILTRDLSLDVYSEKTVKLMMPFKPSELISTIDMMTSFFIRKIRKKSGPPKRSAAQQKIIDDAKALLMERNGMSESEAFRYVQKSSMDTGRTMTESAQMILMLNQ